MEPAELSPIEPASSSPLATHPPEPKQPKAPALELSTLRSVESSHQNLISTVTHLASSLRARHEESLHIHALYTQKLEAVAQRCIQLEGNLSENTKHYEQELRTKDAEIEDLVLETNRLEMETERLDQDAVEREVAIRAMGAAVGGLEGWVAGWTRRQEAKTTMTTPRKNMMAGVNGTPRSVPGSGSRSTKKKTKEVIRGKGRFRGKVLVEEDDDDVEGEGNSPLHRQNGSAPIPRSVHGAKYHSRRHDDDDVNDIPAGSFDVDVSDILDGLKAWVNGFRDVEEGFSEGLNNAHAHPHSNPSPNTGGVRNGTARERETATAEAMEGSRGDGDGEFG